MASADAEELVKQLQAQLNAQGQLDAESLSSLVRQLDKDQNDWCEAAGQSEPLTTRLKNLLKDYPADVGLFKEMVQNADDAGAGRVHFVWDTRKLAKQSLLTPEMAAWQTNCLWAYNDAIFTEQDFEAICRLGVGGKRGSSERIGRFGLGFNSVYNLTDLPSVLSQDMVLFLDPHVTHLARKGASSQKPGIKLRFLKANVLERFRDQFEPYQLLGCDMDASSSPFQGTLIRIPFRTKETAKKSEISSIVVNDEMMEALCQQFQQEAFQWLLFLQNVQEISMSVLKDGSASPQNLFTMSLASATAKLKRPSLVTDKSATRSTLMAKELEILCKGETSKVRRYYLFTDTQHGFRSRVCLAVPERTREQDGDEEGRVFCFLPLPRNIDLGLRLHVHAPLNMAQDRRSMLLDNRIGESEQELVRHNFALLDDLIPSALLACLKDLAVKRNQMPPGHFFALFPSLLHKGGALAPDRIAKSFYARLLDGSSFPLPVAAPAGRQTRVEAPPERWVKITEAVFVPAGNAAVEQVPQALLDSVVEALLRCGVPCVDAPPEVIDSFGRTEQRKPTILTPAWLRQHLRALGKGAPSHALDESSGTSIFAQLKPKDVADFLEFCLSDGLAADLQDVPLLICEDETMVHAFSHKEKAVAALVPQSPLERRLFPNKDGRKLILASRLEARPLVWAKLKQMAAKWENPQAASVPSFQCKFVNFQLLTEALQRLLPRTWNDRVPKVAVTDYIEWVEDWLQAMWKWLDDKDIPLSRMVYWPLIPSVGDEQSVGLFRIPEATKLILFSGTAAPSAPAPPAATASEADTASGYPTEGVPSPSDSQGSLMQELLLRLHCQPVMEPPWLLAHHEKQLRTCVHANSPEGLLRSMHYAGSLLVGPQAKHPSDALFANLCKNLTAKHVKALLSMAATVHKEGCLCNLTGANWKCHCEVLRGLPLLCRFNRPSLYISLSESAKGGELWVLPETCPQVVAALRAAQMELRTCAEISEEVLAAPVTADGFSAAALLRDLALSRPRWCDVLLQHIFPWALQSGSEVRQAVMRAVIYHWRDMELAGHGPCLEGLQRIPFVGTAGGQMVCADQALEPTEQLRSLYPEKGPFPDAVWLSGECRALLRFRAALSYEELAERLGFLHHQEVKRREGGKEAPEVAPAVLQVAQALVRYVCENVSPAMEDESKTPKAPKSEGFWPFDFMTDTKEKKSEQKLSGDQLMSIQSKLKRCFWLPPLSAPGGWPPEAPWRGATSGLCCAEEVRLASEEFLVGMVRPLIGLTSARGGAARLPRRFLESLGLSEKPENGLLNEQLQRMEEWATSLPDAKREVHASWITRCLYDHIYPILLREAVIKEYVSDKTKRLWVPQGGFLPISRMARQSIEFPPYLVKAPAEWKEKVPDLWAKINTCFGVQDYSEALGCIAEAAGGELDLQSLDIAVRLVMAITDKLQQERAQSAPAAAGSKMDILMPTAESQLRPARECVFNNMTWLPEVETAHLNLGNYCLVHPKISHTVAHTCGCRGVSLVVAKDATEMHGADWCEAAGQSEPITTRLKNLLKDYPADVSMFKEMVQNADDAGATEVHIVWDWRQHRKQSLLTPDMDRWQGPGLWVYNDAQFTAKDFDSICRLGVGGKREQSRKIGRFGLGFNSVYNFTDLPSILSGDMVLFLDPHVHHLSAMGASVQKPGILLRFLKIKAGNCGGATQHFGPLRPQAKI
ncbi:unnamed protein product [Effrenium voratum]|uniref:Sacsin/Nov domain-containing protein n=1 Tax=Effrenium voratum TaxID=2562239 RepID=A0AA36I8A5_9DINO|nr:unnamed protein product [Effrenium voratum]